MIYAETIQNWRASKGSKTIPIHYKKKPLNKLDKKHRNIFSDNIKPNGIPFGSKSDSGLFNKNQIFFSVFAVQINEWVFL